MMILTAEYLRSIMDYDPQSGNLTRKTGPRAGHISGSVAKDGYKIIQIKLDKKVSYYAHRLAWLYVHGEWPADQIDHIDGDRANNALANLRECSASQNAQNRTAYKTNKSGLLGVSTKGNRFIAQLTVQGKLLLLAYANSAEEAHAIYLDAKRKYHAFQPMVRSA
jgi:hypothetical protein